MKFVDAEGQPYPDVADVVPEMPVRLCYHPRQLSRVVTTGTVTLYETRCPDCPASTCGVSAARLTVPWAIPIKPDARQADA